VFPIIIPDDLLGQAILLSLDKGEHIRATLVPRSIKYNLNVTGCFEECDSFIIGCIHHANKIDTCMDYLYFSKQEILEKETGEHFFWFKNIIAHHQALKPSDHAFKESLPNPMVTWKDGIETNVSPTLLAFLTLLERIS